MQFCQKMKATHSVVSNEADFEGYGKFIKKTIEANPLVADQCNWMDVGFDFGPTFLLAQHKSKGPVQTSPVKNPYTGDIITYVNWFDGSPNGNFINKGEYWMAFKYNADGSKFIHASNQRPFCFTCDGNGSVLPVLRMRGLCSGSQFDRNYLLASNNEDALFYQGDRHTNITYDKENRFWVIMSNRKVDGGQGKDKPVKGISMVSKFIKMKII